MKKFLLVLFCIMYSISIPCFSQDSKGYDICEKNVVSENIDDYISFPWDKIGEYDKIDESNIEVIYEYTEFDPSLEKNQLLMHEVILQIGDSLTSCKDYQGYIRDSIRIFLGDIDTFEAINRTNMYRQTTNEHILRNRMTGKILLNDMFSHRAFSYEEPVSDFGWELSEDTMTVCGYLCRKATCDFRGRKWTVWYAEELAIDAGPWKFCGLPGLVLQAKDEKDEYLYNAIRIRKPAWSRMTRVNLGKCFSRSDFRQTEKNFRLHYREFMSSDPDFAEFAATAKWPERIFYNPKEKE